MPNRLDSGLGMQGVPAFPANFSNIGPSEQKAGPTRFTGGVPATMGIGGINSAYPSSLGLSGRDYAPMRDQSGQTIYGGPLRMSQPQAFGGGGLERRENTITDQPFSFTNASGGLANEGYNFRQPSRNTFALPSQTSIPIDGGPLSVGINRAQTAGQMGRTAIQNPYGTVFATDQQQANMNAPRSPDQQNSRTPQQQQELLDNIRKNAPALNQQRTDWVQNTIQQRRENPTTYKSPSGMSVAVPTNRFGAPIKAWMDQLGDSGRLNYGPKPAPKTASAASPQPIRGARFENLNSFNPSESFTGSMASNYAPPTTIGFGNRTRISGEKRNSSPMSDGIMSAFDSGMSVVPSYMPSFPTGVPPNNSMAMGVSPSPFGSGFSAIF